MTEERLEEIEAILRQGHYPDDEENIYVVEIPFDGSDYLMTTSELRKLIAAWRELNA